MAEAPAKTAAKSAAPAQKDPIKAILALEDLQPKIEQHANALQALMEEANLTIEGLEGQRVKSVQVYVTGVQNSHKPTLARIVGLKKRVAMWRGMFEDMGIKVG